MSTRMLSIAALAALAIVSSAASAVVTRAPSAASPAAAALGTASATGTERDRTSASPTGEAAERDAGRTTWICHARSQPAPGDRGAHESSGATGARAYVAGVRARALKGDRDAMFALARIYHRGTRVPTDYTEALRWYRLAALRGHPEARRTLALILANPSTNESIDAAWMHFLASGVPPEIALAVLASRQEMLAEREPLYSLETLHLEPVSSNTTTCEVLP